MTTATKEVVEQKQYLTFLLANEEYAIGILKVKEIIEYDTVTTVPKTPKWVRGVINLRGAVVPVVDLAIKFGLELKPVTKTTCIVIVETQFESQNTTIGILVDAVSQVMELATETCSRCRSLVPGKGGLLARHGSTGKEVRPAARRGQSTLHR